MQGIFNKLWASKGTISIILWTAVFAWIYTLDYTKRPATQHILTGRTVEEIIASPVDKIAEPAWDKDFKSSVEAVK